MIPEICFASSTDNPNPFGSNTLLDKDGLSPLLICEDCKVCVHASKSTTLFIVKHYKNFSLKRYVTKNEKCYALA